MIMNFNTLFRSFVSFVFNCSSSLFVVVCRDLLDLRFFVLRANDIYEHCKRQYDCINRFKHVRPSSCLFIIVLAAKMKLLASNLAGTLKVLAHRLVSKTEQIRRKTRLQYQVN